MRAYRTEQRERLLDFFAGRPDEQFTVEALGRALPGVSISAIYRNVNRMVAGGTVRRFQKEGSRTFMYQYIGGGACAGHLHFKCHVCGAILHMDGAATEAVMDAVRRRAGLHLDMQQTLLLGRCAACAQTVQ